MIEFQRGGSPSLTDRNDDVQDSVRTAELERLIADSIGPPLSALCDRLSLGTVPGGNE
jgi:hypothetical protein